MTNGLTGIEAGIEQFSVTSDAQARDQLNSELGGDAGCMREELNWKKLPMKKLLLTTVVLGALGIASLSAASLQLSIGIRETGGSGPAFSNGGSANGIEFVDLDGQTLIADGTWQLFTFTPTVDTLTAFAGATADGILSSDWVVLEHVRIRNSDGLTGPIQMWIDNISNTTSGGTVTEGFESATLGTEVIFQEPNFSGSTAGNLVAGGTSLISDSAAFAGSQANEVNFEFVDADTTRWVRLTTFGTPNLPNPALLAREVGFNPTISFYAMAVVPEPSTWALGLLGVGLWAWFRRRKA